MSKLWKKNEVNTDAAIEHYTAGSDYLFDMHIMPYDVAASRVHAQALTEIGVLRKDELAALLDALASFESDITSGNVTITPQDEDGHTVIENYLVSKVGEIGKKIHTGRSRNDQVAVAVRLYMKAMLREAESRARNLASKFLETAHRYEKVPMPGFSHTQQAMLCTVGHYFAAHAESIIDDIELIGSVESYLDKNPLGSAAGFGTSIPIDRMYTTRHLGFASLQLNSLYVQNSRGKFESVYLEALVQVMLTLGKFANDAIFFTSNEFGYFSANDSVTTGSSIMPHKKNLDPMELLRGNVSVAIANQLMVRDITKNLLSGYNRDGQLIKKPLIETTEIVLESIRVAEVVLDALVINESTIIAKLNKGIFTADIANQMVLKEGIPFRDAYVKAATLTVEEMNLAENIESKVSLGSPGNIGLDLLGERLVAGTGKLQQI